MEGFQPLNTLLASQPGTSATAPAQTTSTVMDLKPPCKCGDGRNGMRIDVGDNTEWGNYIKKAMHRRKIIDGIEIVFWILMIIFLFNALIRKA